MKKHNAPGLWGLVAEMIQTTGDIGIQCLTDLCSGIVKEGCIPEDWKSSVVLPVYKGKGDPVEFVSDIAIFVLKKDVKLQLTN